MLAPAFPDFLLRNISDQPRVRLSLLRKAHEVAQRHQPRREIRDTWAENEILRMLSRPSREVCARCRVTLSLRFV
jgi:hypothetical protein